MFPDLHADVVGSLLRPPTLLAAREQLASGAISPAAFKVVEDRAVDEVVALQEAAGLEVVTDGEMRRLSFQSQMTEAVAGFGASGLETFVWGEWFGDGLTGDWRGERPRGIGVIDRLRRKRHLSVEEFVYLRSRTDRLVKVTLPSPGLFMNFWSAAGSAPYPTLDRFLADVVQILRDEVLELSRLGATYIQIDAPHYPLLLDPRTSAFYESLGWDLDRWLSLGIELDNAVMADVPGVCFGFHLCRGNQASRWLVAGDYERIAEPLLRGIRAGRLLLEYDDERSGSFAPLRHLPEDKMAVLGLVTTKRAELEPVSDLVDRIREAGRYVPVERLALSPQCGFSTSILGNDLTVDDQRHKLARVRETADRVWGG